MIFSIVIFFSGIVVYGGYYTFRVSNATQHIFTGTANTEQSLLKTFTDIARPPISNDLRGFDDGRINILLLGKAGTEKKGADLTDTLMLASVDLTTHRVALLSLPRDLLVLNKNSAYTKINSLYARGLYNNEGADRITSAVEAVTDQDVHYYLVMDFEGFEKIVDALGGINIDVPREIYDDRYPGPGYSYETFSITKGFHALDGATALKYARSRHDDPESDFGRAKRQQQILRAIRNKALSIGTLANPFKVTELLTALSDHIDTNIATHEIRAFVDLGKKLDTHNITTVVLDAWKKDSLLISTRKHGPNYSLAGLSPRTGTWDDVHEHANLIFDLPKITARREEIKNEKTRIHLVNASSSGLVASRISSLLTGAHITITKSSTLTEPQPSSFIIDHSKKTKSFSFDEIVKTVTHNTKPFFPPALSHLDTTQKSPSSQTKNSYDFTVVLGEDLLETYLYEETTEEDIEEDNTKKEE